MADIVTPDRKLIVEPEVQYPNSVSEATFTKIGGVVNHINTRQVQHHIFTLNGPYGQVASVPILGLDGILPIEGACEIVNIGISNLTAGSSGTTEIDVKYSASPGAAFNSIFSTTPKIASTAASGIATTSYSRTVVGSTETWTLRTPPTGVTLGQFSAPYALADNGSLRVDLITAMPGAEGALLVIYWRPV